MGLTEGEFDYLEAASFFPDKAPYGQVETYAVFGGSPYVLDQIDPEASLRET